MEAIESELNSMKRLKVYKETQLPPGEKAIGCRWVFKRKPLAEGSFKCKARLVAKGFLQRKYIHYAAQRKYVISHCGI